METIDYISNGKTVGANLYRPATATPRGVIAIAYGSEALAEPWGAMIDDYGQSLAGRDYVAFVPKYLGAAPPPVEAVLAMIVDSRDAWEASIRDGLRHVQALAGVGPLAVGLLGFSLGGYLVLRIRRGAKVLVEYFAPLLAGQGGIGNDGGALAHALIQHGDADGLVDFASNALPIRALLTAQGVQAELISYPGATHGFATDSAADADARTQSRDSTMLFFESFL